MSHLRTFLLLTSVCMLLLSTSCFESGDQVSFSYEGDGAARVTVYLGQETDDESAAKRVDSWIEGMFGWRMLTEADDITRVEVEIQPANVIQDLAETGSDTYARTFILPVGFQTFTARAYAGSGAEEEQVGEGSAQATIETNQTSNVEITILDTTGAPANPSHAPVITSLTASKTNPVVDESITLEVTAIDPDDDEMTYVWSDDCDGVFTADDQAQTNWSNDQSIACAVTVTVSDGTYEAEASINVTVYESSSDQGTAEIGARYLENPYITAFQVGSCYFDWRYTDCLLSDYPNPVWGHGYECRGLTNATCPESFSPGEEYNLYLVFRHIDSSAGIDSASVNVSDNCGGTATYYNSDIDSALYHWQAPNDPGLCMLTINLEQNGLSDTVDIAIPVGTP